MIDGGEKMALFIFKFCHRDYLRFAGLKERNTPAVFSIDFYHNVLADEFFLVCELDIIGRICLSRFGEYGRRPFLRFAAYQNKQ
jgi:hypothetical protein